MCVCVRACVCACLVGVIGGYKIERNKMSRLADRIPAFECQLLADRMSRDSRTIGVCQINVRSDSEQKFVSNDKTNPNTSPN